MWSLTGVPDTVQFEGHRAYARRFSIDPPTVAKDGLRATKRSKNFLGSRSCAVSAFNAFPRRF